MSGSGGGKAHSLERWNTHFSTVVEQEVLGVPLRLAQDPNSEHLGTTVWDASIVMAKFFEKNIRKGEFARAKVSGKRAIDLGSGMGLGGLAFALLGADVVLSDVAAVLPLLRRNYEHNLSAAALRASGAEGHLCSCGRVSVAEVDWSVPQHYTSLVPPPFDYVLAADCIYHEHLVRHLYRCMLAITSERTTILVANERRSESVQAAFVSLFSPSFSFKKVPLAKQDPSFSHPLIELWLLKRRKGASDENLRALEAAEAAEARHAAGGPDGPAQQPCGQPPPQPPPPQRQEALGSGGQQQQHVQQAPPLASQQQQQQQQQRPAEAAAAGAQAAPDGCAAHVADLQQLTASLCVAEHAPAG